MSAAERGRGGGLVLRVCVCGCGGGGADGGGNGGRWSLAAQGPYGLNDVQGWGFGVE